MLGLLTVHISSITAHHAPAIPASWQPELVLDVDLWYDVLRILLHWVDLKRLDRELRFRREATRIDHRKSIKGSVDMHMAVRAASRELWTAGSKMAISIEIK